MASAPAGPGVPRNPDQLVEDFRMAVEGGNAKSALELVKVMCDRNVPREKIEGLVVYLRANTPRNAVLRQVLLSSDPKMAAQDALLHANVILGGGSRKKNRKTQRRKNQKSRKASRRH
jgi:uncharacterized membrane protein YvbJ